MSAYLDPPISDWEDDGSGAGMAVLDDFIAAVVEPAVKEVPELEQRLARLTPLQRHQAARIVERTAVLDALGVRLVLRERGGLRRAQPRGHVEPPRAAPGPREPDSARPRRARRPRVGLREGRRALIQVMTAEETP